MAETVESVSAADPSKVNGDLTCLVTAVIATPPEHLKGPNPVPFGYLRVWDGTGPSRTDDVPVNSLAAQAALASGDPGPDALKSVISLVKDFDTSKKKNAALPPALCGRVVNVAVWEEVRASERAGGWAGGRARRACGRAGEASERAGGRAKRASVDMGHSLAPPPLPPPSPPNPPP
jgi:hypothetical protein